MSASIEPVPQDPVVNDPPREAKPTRTLDPEELRRCTALIEAIIEDRGLISQVSEPERRAFLIAAGRVSRPNRQEIIQMAKAHRRDVRQKSQARDRVVRNSVEIRAARKAEVFAPPPLLPADASTRTQERVLEKARICYVCKVEFRHLHYFYDSMCDACAELNYAKRFQTASLKGRVALITGARLKIGYQAALMMLRAGASVIVTTRFPQDAAQRFSREADFADWGARLKVHGLDLRHSPSVEIFTRYLNQTCDRLDILINNAAQTVRRPPGFYAHLMELEATPYAKLPEPMRHVLSAHEACKGALDSASLPEASLPEHTGLTAWSRSVPGAGPGIGLRSSAALSQLPASYEDVAHGLEVFPAGRTDADLQQVDLRTQNSWRMTLGEVPTPEMLEVQLVNSVAPFILCSKLKPLMLRDRTDEKHIVNVSAMEGKFTRYTKTDKHPHTNMAKAALNMMTLTSAPDYAKDGIFMNAVDTGWVTDEDPAHHAQRKLNELDFQPPLDIVDGAARICDPFFHGLLTGEHVWGKFLKDYKPTDW